MTSRPHVSAVLVDADGVIQRPSASWLPALTALCADAHRADAFLAEVFAAERPCVTGAVDFAAALAPVLGRFGCTTPPAHVVELWTRIDLDPVALGHVERLRRGGLTVGLASNQHAHRAAFMTHGLGYAARFDHLFYSCDLGVSKPSHDFFRAALAALARPAGEVLFVDDHPANVLAAREVGLVAEVVDSAAALAAVLERHRLG